MFVFDLFESQQLKKVVIMSGGFHPWHPGHTSLYQSAKASFPGADVWVAATNDTKARPFPFETKRRLAIIAGVDGSKFVQVKSPFNPVEITGQYDPNTTAVIFVRSEKDAGSMKLGGFKKDGSPAYIQPMGKDLMPIAQHAYMDFLPTIDFKAGNGGINSATQIRAMWPTADENAKTGLVHDLYPAIAANPSTTAKVIQMLDAALGAVTESVNEDEENPIDTVKLDIPLMIRMLEFAKEDVKTDMELHTATEQLIALSTDGQTLSMDDYEQIVSPAMHESIQRYKKKMLESIEVKVLPRGVERKKALVGLNEEEDADWLSARDNPPEIRNAEMKRLIGMFGIGGVKRARGLYNNNLLKAKPAEIKLLLKLTKADGTFKGLSSIGENTKVTEVTKPTNPNRKMSAHQKEVAQKRKEYEKTLGNFTPKDDMVGVAKKVTEGNNDSKIAALQKKYDDCKGALGMARERRKAKGQHVQGPREMALTTKMSAIYSQLSDMQRASKKVTEVSNNTLSSYKKKAGEQATAADKKGDFKTGDKRFKGIVKATSKQFDNDAKKVATEMTESARNGRVRKVQQSMVKLKGLMESVSPKLLQSLIATVKQAVKILDRNRDDIFTPK